MVVGCYAVKHKNSDVIKNSRSGGIFTALSDYVLMNNGVAYGCVQDQNMIVKHTRAESALGRDLMRGSKYVQSKMRDSYKQVKTDLINGKLVLFTGTGCQVAGLKCFLGHNYQNLITVDIVCHGVPSPLVWKKYIMWRKRQGDLQNYNFRDKNKFKWEVHVEKFEFTGGKIIYSQLYKNLFLSHVMLRPCCHECKFKSVPHNSDITIGDFWGIGSVYPEFDDHKGTSLVICNTEKGNDILNKCKSNLQIKEVELEKAQQPALNSSYSVSAKRQAFWKDFYQMPFEKILKKYAGYTIKYRAKQIVKRVMGKLYME